MTNISYKTVKTRRPHQCFACERTFPIGSIMDCQTNVDDGSIYTNYNCESCGKLMLDFRDVFNDGDCFPLGCVKDCLTIDIQTPEELYIELTNFYDKRKKERQAAKELSEKGDKL